MSALLPDSARILVVDDDPGLLVLISKMLERVGPKPITSETGHGALAILEREPIDLLILDLMLPDLDGLAVLEHIRDDSRFDLMPILIRVRGLQRIQALTPGGKTDRSISCHHQVTTPATTTSTQSGPTVSMQRGFPSNGRLHPTDSCRLISRPATHWC